MFDVVDLFAGIGGFHGALAPLGGRVVLAAEIDPRAARVYELNWGLTSRGDVRDLAADPLERVPRHAVLAGGFPCQPFSKSGRQLGMAEERGTLFHEVVKILEAWRPPVVFLENVRNIAGPRQRPAWDAVVRGLRHAGYLVSSTPCVFSPHLLAPSEGGAPQIRERVYILGVYVGRARAEREVTVPPVMQNAPQGGWSADRWSIKDHVLPLSSNLADAAVCRLSDEEHSWINTWNWLLKRLGPGAHLPGFPLWSDVWRERFATPANTPQWKQAFIEKNLRFYDVHRDAIREWRAANPQIASFPESRRKLEWQAQDAPRDLWQLLLHLRPSGIRAKKPTYAPALVAMGQTSIYGPARRRLTPAEAATLQGFPSRFDFGGQATSLSYRQLGNAVNMGAARYVFRRYVEKYASEIVDAGDLGAAVVAAVQKYSGVDAQSEEVLASA